MIVPRVAPDASIDAVETALRESGCVVVDNIISDEEIDRVRAELEPYLDATPAGGDEFTGFNTRRTGSLLARSREFAALAAHPTVTGTLDRVLGDHVPRPDPALGEQVEALQPAVRE